jgi:hypothetical protein
MAESVTVKPTKKYRHKPSKKVRYIKGISKNHHFSQ